MPTTPDAREIAGQYRAISLQQRIDYRRQLSRKVCVNAERAGRLFECRTLGSERGWLHPIGPACNRILQGLASKASWNGLRPPTGQQALEPGANGTRTPEPVPQRRIARESATAGDPAQDPTGPPLHWRIFPEQRVGDHEHSVGGRFQVHGRAIADDAARHHRGDQIPLVDGDGDFRRTSPPPDVPAGRDLNKLAALEGACALASGKIGAANDVT
jgi:hypothetical protein